MCSIFAEGTVGDQHEGFSTGTLEKCLEEKVDLLVYRLLVPTSCHSAVALQRIRRGPDKLPHQHLESDLVVRNSQR